MTHLEAQSYIMPFIEGKVPDNKQEDFVIHMKNCKTCHEELEIYYTLLVGMKKLDSQTEISTDFSTDLERELSRMSHHVRNRRSVKVSAFSVIMAAFLLLGVAVYAGVLNKVQDFEQRSKLADQGGFYYHDYLDSYFQLDDKDNIAKSMQIKKDKEVTGYQRILGYKRLESDYDKMMLIGEDIAQNEATTD